MKNTIVDAQYKSYFNRQHKVRKVDVTATRPLLPNWLFDAFKSASFVLVVRVGTVAASV